PSAVAPQCVRTPPRRPALGALSSAFAAPRAPGVLPQSPRPAPPLYRTAAPRGGAPGPAAPARPAPPRPRPRLGRPGWGAPRPRVGPGGQPAHGAAPAPPAACPCHLLVFYFMPRIWDLKDQQLYRLDRFVDYGVFTPLLTKTADLTIVEEQ